MQLCPAAQRRAGLPPRGAQEKENPIFYSRLSRKLDKIETSLSGDDLPELWLGWVRRFRNIGEYAVWFGDPANAAKANAAFQRQARNVLRDWPNKSRWGRSRFEVLHDAVHLLNLFVEVNLECARTCDQLVQRFRNLATEASEILFQLGGNRQLADCNYALVCELARAAAGFAHYFAIDWSRIEAACLQEGGGGAGVNPQGGLLQRLKDALEEGMLEEGRMVFLPTFPIPELRGVPLVDGEWIDVAFIGGARHKPRRGKLSAADLKNLLDEVSGAGDGFGVETRLIDGRPHIRFSAYRAQANQDYEISQPGITLASLLGWFDAAGRRVGNGETDNSVTQRGTDSGPMRDTPPPSSITCLARKVSPELPLRAQEWAEQLRALLADVNQLNALVYDCGRTHFRGRPALFFDVDFKLGLLTILIRSLLRVCNAASDLNLFPFSCYIDPADDKVRNPLGASQRLGELIERADQKVRLTEPPTWSPRVPPSV